MKQMAWAVGAALLLVVSSAPSAQAADKAHQQLIAEIRMLQEQQQQLQQMLGGLADTLKVVTSKLDDQTGANRKGFADQKLQIDNVAEGVRVLREKADDTNVRLSTVSQELEAVRQAISSIPARASGARPGRAQGPRVAPAGGTHAPHRESRRPGLISPQKMYTRSRNMDGHNYRSGIKAFTRAFRDRQADMRIELGMPVPGGMYRDEARRFGRVQNRGRQRRSCLQLGSRTRVREIDLARGVRDRSEYRRPPSTLQSSAG